MLRLLSNSIDYSIPRSRAIIPHSINHNAFKLPFFKVFKPRISCQDLFAIIDKDNLPTEFQIQVPSETGQAFLSARLNEISLGWSGEPKYDGTRKNTSYYKLKIGDCTIDNYQLCINGASDEYSTQITTGEFASTKGYTVSDSFIKHLTVSKEISAYLSTRERFELANYIGVHLRYSKDKRADVDDIAKRIRSKMTEHATNKLYLATDSLAGYRAIAEVVPEAEILSPAKLIDLDSLGVPNLHSLPEEQLTTCLGISKLDQIGLAIADLWCLLQTKDFVGSNSEFSRLASRLREHQDKQLVSSFFKGDYE